MNRSPPRDGESAGQFRRFAVIGAAGFFVDAAALMLATAGLGLGLYGGRVFSYLCAATFTWALNRRFTFALADGPPRGRAAAAEWLRFLGANAFGGLVNYGVYAVIVGASAVGAQWPVIAVAAGSIAGLVFNFSASKFWVFARR